MPWACDKKSHLGAWLRPLVVLIMLVAVALPASLLGAGPSPAVLDPGNSGIAAHSSNGAGEAQAAAAKKHKRNADGKRKADKKGKQDEQDKNKKGKKQGKRKADKKGKQGKRTAAGAAAAPLTFVPVADAQVNEANPNYNYGTRDRLLVDGGADPDIAAYLRFDLSGVPSPVQRATLRLWVQSNGGTVDGPAVQATGTSWNETSLTWANRPQPSGGVLDDKGKLPNGAWAEYDVTGAVGGNGAVGFVLLPQTNDGAVFDSREGANKPQLVVTIGDVSPAPTPTPTPNPTPNPTPTPPGSNVNFPVRAAFYYPWFPEAWEQSRIYPYTNYQPSLGYYDGGDADTIRKHIAAMQYGGIALGIASWWGIGEHTDEKIPALLSASAGTNVRWALYYEDEGSSDPSVERLRADLTYIRDHYASDPSYARVDGKFVVFVYNANDGNCAVADRWQQANTVGAYVVLKVFSGYRNCANQPQSWHQYSPAVAADRQAGYSYSISPGFWQKGQSVRLPRDLARWRQNVRDMVASGAPWQLVATFNEWGEGTSVESAVEWESASGYGAYLDALHRDGQP